MARAISWAAVFHTCIFHVCMGTSDIFETEDVGLSFTLSKWLGIRLARNVGLAVIKHILKHISRESQPWG